MKVLVIGSGGREQAIAWKLAQSPRVKKVFLAPGNAGTIYNPMLENIPCKYSAYNDATLAKLTKFASQENISFTVVGPEAPLAAGIVDQFRSQNLKIFGPTKLAAQLESSKSFAKTFMQRHGIPTAAYKCFTNVKEAESYLNQRTFPIVIKTDGLAEGKGVFIPQNLDESIEIVKKLLNKKGNNAPNKGNHLEPSIVIEDFLEGEEASFMVMTDGSNIIPLATSQDHKRLLNADKGPNTGGMGAYSPAPIITQEIHSRIMNEIIKPTILGMKNEGNSYTGFLYAGILINPNGDIYTLEFNCRLGDPETQVLMPRMKGDFATLIESAINAQLDKETKIEWEEQFALCIVAASPGYPNESKIGLEIIFDQEARNPKYLSSGLNKNHALIFHGATKLESSKILTNGGRVLSVVAMASSLETAQKQAYQALKKIHFDGMQYREDIGYRAINKK